jgi:hypothetical protein
MNKKSMFIQNIKRDFRLAINDIFKENLEFAFLCGKTAFGVFNNDSDIDVVVVLRNKFVKSPRKFLTAKRMFMEVYFELHKRYGLKPDYLWPGEYVSVSQMGEAALGRAVELKGGNLSPPRLMENNELGNDKIYSYWWSMLIFSKFLTGNRRIYSNLRKNAASTLIRFALYDQRLKKINDERSILEFCINFYHFLGIDYHYQTPNFFKSIIPTFKAALVLLVGSQVLIKKEGSYQVTDKLTIWAKKLFKKTKNSQWNTSVSKSYYL